MSIEQNKETARRFIETANSLHGHAEKIPAYIREFFAPEFVFHIGTNDMNLEQFEAFERNIITVVPDGHHTIERLVAEDDVVVIHRTADGGGQSFKAVDIFRLAGGKFIEGWIVAEAPPPV